MALCCILDEIDISISPYADQILHLSFSLLKIQGNFNEKMYLLSHFPNLTKSQVIVKKFIWNDHISTLFVFLQNLDNLKAVEFWIMTLKNCVTFNHQIDQLLLSRGLAEKLLILLQTGSIFGKKEIVIHICLICINLMSSSRNVASAIINSEIPGEMIQHLGHTPIRAVIFV